MTGYVVRSLAVAFMVGFLLEGLGAQTQHPSQIWVFKTLGLEGEGDESFVDVHPGNDGLPYTEDDIALPFFGNRAGKWSSAHHDLNSNGLIEDNEHIFVIFHDDDGVGDWTSFSAMSHPEYGALYESQDWQEWHDARNEGPSATLLASDPDAAGQDFEHNDGRAWETESNAYLYNHLRADQHGKGKSKYYLENVNRGSAPEAGEPWVYDEIEGWRKPLNFWNDLDDPATPFNERGSCRRDYFRTIDATTRGYLIPAGDLEGLQDGELETLFGWESVDLAAYLRDIIAPKLEHEGLNYYEEFTFQPGLLPPTHILLLQTEAPIVVNVGETCSLGQEQAQGMADYWGIPEEGATYRVSHILGLHADTMQGYWGPGHRAWKDLPDDDAERNVWVLDHFFRDDSADIGRYDLSGGPWEIAEDPGGLVIDLTENKVLLTDATLGRSSARAPLPRPLDATERPIEVVVDLAVGARDPGAGDGGAPLKEIHQVIVETAGDVAAYAEISHEPSSPEVQFSVHLGGTLEPDGFASGSDRSTVKDGAVAWIGDLAVGAYTRFVLRVTEDTIALLGARHGEYAASDFESLGLDDQLVSLSAVAAVGVDAVRFSTTGVGPPSSVGVSTVAVFAAPLGGEQRGGLQQPGDNNQDGTVDLSDPIWLLEALYSGALTELPCGTTSAEDPTPGGLEVVDWQPDGAIDLADAIASLYWQFAAAQTGQGPHHLGLACMPVRGCPDNPRCAQ